MQNIIEKKWDLNYIYDMAKQAIEAGDIDQAIKLSKKGLREAELQVNAEWKLKFEKFTNKIKSNYTRKETELEEKEEISEKKIVEENIKDLAEKLNASTSVSTESHDTIIKQESYYKLRAELKEKYNLIQKINKSVVAEDFHIISQLGREFEKICSDIDLTIIKTIRTKNSKNILLVCPIIVNLIEDNLIISEQKAKYDLLLEKNMQLDTWIEELIEIQQFLLENITSGKPLFQYLQEFLMVELDVNISPSKDILLYSKGTRFKLYIDPIFISNSAVRFIEKSLPFAYQRRSNIHFIENSQLIELLHFLEKKYYSIEVYSNEEPPEKELYKAKERFQKTLRLYSIPFVGYGALIIILAVSQLGFLLQTFIGLSYGILGIYAGMIGFLYYTFRVKQREIKNSFLIPHYQRTVPLDDTSLEIISQELTDELMLQFGYECFGKIITHKVLTKIEQKQAEKYLVEKEVQNYNELFEHEKEEKSEIDSDYIARFGDFLDD